MSKKGAEVGGGEAAKVASANGLPTVAAKEVDQPVSSRDIGADSVRRAAPVMIFSIAR